LHRNHLADLSAQPSLQHVQVFINLAQDDLGVELQAGIEATADFRKAHAGDFEAFLHELIQRGGGRVDSFIAAMVGDNHKNLAGNSGKEGMASTDRLPEGGSFLSRNTPAVHTTGGWDKQASRVQAVAG
jgi:hypothetical protein